MDDGATEPRWAAAVTAGLEGLVGTFALFTVLHLVAVGLGWDATPVGLVWLLLSVPLVAAWVWSALREADRAPEVSAAGAAAADRPWLTWVVVAGALVTGLLSLLPTEGVAFQASWVVGSVTAVLGLVLAARAARSGSGPTYGRRVVASWEHLTAVGLCLGLGVLSLFVVNPSADDVYYVNRSTWVAERGTFPLKDTLFSWQGFEPVYGSGLPIGAVEDLFGTLARLLGLAAPTFVYVVVAPVLVVLASWSTWALVSTWVPRLRLVALAVALAVPALMASGIVGDFGPARSWQGKVVAVALLLPLVWTHLTRLGDGTSTRMRSVSVLGACGVAWCGLTLTAPVFAPLPAAVALLAGVLARHHRGALLTGAAALVAAPLVTGIATVLDDQRPPVEKVFTNTPVDNWVRVFGTDRPLAALAVTAVLLASLVVPGVTARLLLAGAALVELVAVAPGVPALFGHLTGAGPIAHRMLLTAPIAVTVGALVAHAVGLLVPGEAGGRRASWSSGRPARTTTAVAVVAALAVAVVTSTPVWSSDVGGSLTTRPSWKVNLRTIPDVVAVQGEHPGKGPVLLTDTDMRTLAIATTRTLAVVPRTLYVNLLEEPREQHLQRQTLRRFVDNDFPDPPTWKLRQALAGLGVTLACAYPDDREDHVAALREAGWVHLRRLGRLVCFDPPERAGRGVSPRGAPTTRGG